MTKKVLKAIATIRDHLDDQWIDDQCCAGRSMDCSSCRAKEIDSDLDMLANAIERAMQVRATGKQQEARSAPGATGNRE